MAFTSYLTTDGKIHSQVSGGVAIGYLTDALGSVVGTVDSSGNVTNTYRYKPYGSTLAKTGSSADPKNLWVGSFGYRATSRIDSEYYMQRARHYGSNIGRWTSVSKFWPQEQAYAYRRSGSRSTVKPLPLPKEKGKPQSMVRTWYESNAIGSMVTNRYYVCGAKNLVDWLIKVSGQSVDTVTSSCLISLIGAGVTGGVGAISFAMLSIINSLQDKCRSEAIKAEMAAVKECMRGTCTCYIVQDTTVTMVFASSDGFSGYSTSTSRGIWCCSGFGDPKFYRSGPLV
jgi:hypothetical protein